MSKPDIIPSLIHEGKAHKVAHKDLPSEVLEPPPHGQQPALRLLTTPVTPGVLWKRARQGSVQVLETEAPWEQKLLPGL